jgi:hypothetical protein
MTKIEFLRKKWAEAVSRRALRDDHSADPDEDAFERLRAADPTTKAIYSEFVMRTYVAGHFLMEDVERIAETLRIFHSAKRRLAVERRDIGIYESERAVWDMLADAGLVSLADTSGKAEKRAARDRAYRESEVLHSGGWTMAVPLTAEAARWWGMGTRWCTTERTGRTFHYYRGKGPLRVFVSPSGEKHQAHLATMSFCDAKDAPADLGGYLRAENFPEAFLKALKSDLGGLCDDGGKRGFDLLTGLEALRTFDSVAQWVPSSVFAAEVTQVRHRFIEWGLTQVDTLESVDGWELHAARNPVGAWALLARHLGVKEFRTSRNQLPWLLISPEGETALMDFHAPDAARLRPVVSEMPAPLRERVLTRFLGSVAPPLNMVFIASLPTALRLDLGSAFWCHWARALCEFEKNISLVAKDVADFDVPPERMDEAVAMVFAKAGKKDSIPAHLVTEAVARSLAKARPEMMADDEIVALLSEDAIAMLCAGGNGHNARYLPRTMRNATMFRKILGHGAWAFPSLLQELGKGGVDLEGETPETLADELAVAAVSGNAALVTKVDVALPRQVYLDVVRREPSNLKWVPLEYRDVEMCLASLDREILDGLPHFPVWAAEIIKANRPDLASIMSRYRPSAAHADELRAAEPHAGPAPAKLPTWKALSAKQKKALLLAA